jgi:hypothetical protein
VTTHVFTALGFDPAPGSTDALERLARHCSGFGRELADDAGRVRAVRDGGLWTGSAADAFRHQLDEVPRDLDRAGDAYHLAGAALARFSAALAEHQVAARSLEQQAQAVTRLLDAAPADHPAASHERDLDALRAEAARLRNRVLADARGCRAALQDATRHAPRPPGRFHRLCSEAGRLAHDLDRAVGDFVRDHAAQIAAIAGIAAKTSSALAVVAMLVGPVPVLGEAVGGLAATGALMAGGVALAGHAALAVWAGGSWTPVLLDAAALVTGAAPRGVERVAGRVAASRGLDLGGEGAPTMRAALAAVRHPSRSLEAGAQATLTFPRLVTRTVSYQFDLAAGGLGVYDLAQAGRLPAEVGEARERAERSRRSPASAGAR